MVVSMNLWGCQTNDQAKGQRKENAEVTYIQKKSDVDQGKADTAKREVSNMKEVEKVTAASVDNDIYVALTVEGFDRFFLERIRKDAQDAIKKKYKQDHIHVSTDRKISSELEAIEKRLLKNGVKKEQLKTELKKIEDDMKG